MCLGREQAMQRLFEHGKEKFPRAGVSVTSAALGWTGIASEVRSHPACALPPFVSSQTEITINLQGRPGAHVKRSAGGARQHTAAGAGTIWITPGGSCEEATQITESLPEVAHIYLSQSLLSGLNAAEGTLATAPSIDYVADVRDDLIRQIGLSLVAEMRTPTPGGKVLAESLGVTLAARILQRHSASSTANAGSSRPAGHVDDARVRRVIDYMMAHLEDPVGLEDLASVACLSPFHFARTFRLKAGLPPHQFLGRLRLEHAKALLARSNRSISDIALACQFSSQSNFSRAFKEFTGSTPHQFRTFA
jgi:AraC family transcriptional regulator